MGEGGGGNSAATNETLCALGRNKCTVALTSDDVALLIVIFISHI